MTDGKVIKLALPGTFVDSLTEILSSSCQVKFGNMEPAMQQTRH